MGVKYYKTGRKPFYHIANEQNSKMYVKARECQRAISEDSLYANFTSRNRVHPEKFRTERAISNAPL